MAKYAGYVGCSIQKEDPPGVWKDTIEERWMRGDVIGASGRFTPGESINDDVVLGHRISLIGNPYLYENFTSLRYITHMGVKWKIVGVEIQRPRLIVSLGGTYNG